MRMNEKIPKDDENMFKILLATDIHLGYAENDPIRGNDSLVTFEEILSIGKENKVDFILLGGDLFHLNKPSRQSLEGCMQLLRRYSLGDKPVQFEFLSDQSVNFQHSSFPIANYLDPNLNVGIPVFSIHGNHDDPSGLGNYCPLDILSTSGLVNYFGKSTHLDEINISPLLMQKGHTKLALYGLGSIRDERLHRLFREGKVTMLRPRQDTDSWFNIFVLHQNRSKHGNTNYIPENFLDPFLDLVFWGHEHECRIRPEYNATQSFYVTQPGSPIATSLCPGEAEAKHVGILCVNGKDFKIIPIPLTTVRQFYIETIDLNAASGLDFRSPTLREDVFNYCSERIDGLLMEAEKDHSGNPKQPKMPLIRLKVEYTGKLELFNVVKFGQKYSDQVANRKDIILFKQRHLTEEKGEKKSILSGTQREVLMEHNVSSVEALVTKYFAVADDANKMKILSETGMAAAIEKFVEKEHIEAINSLISHQISKVRSHLVESKTPVDKLDEEISSFRNFRQSKFKEEENEIKDVLDSSTANGSLTGRSTADTRVVEEEDFMDESSLSMPPPARGRRGRGRGSSAAPRGAGARGGNKRGRAKSSGQTTLNFSARHSSRTSTQQSRTSSVYMEDSDDDVEIIENHSDDDSQRSTSSRRSTSTRIKTSSSLRSMKRGITYDSDSDEGNNPFS